MKTIRTLDRISRLSVLALLAGCDGSGDDRFSLPETAALSAPTILQAAQTTDGVGLDWPAEPGVESYAMLRCPVPAGVTDALCENTPANACGAPVAVTTGTSFFDRPPATVPRQAYCYRLRACSDSAGAICGPVVASVASARRVEAPLPQMSTVIGDDGREVIAGLDTTLHAFPEGATGQVFWNWLQESGPGVTLVGADTQNLAFTAPDVSVNTLLSFELRVTDDNGPGRPSKVAVTVVPASNVIVKADTDGRQVQAGHEVSLHARGSAQNLDYAWRQLSPATPQVVLTGADTDNPSFIAPVLPAGGVLHFEVTASDPITGRNASARTGVAVLAAVPERPGPSPEPLQIAQPLQVPPPLALPVPLPLTTVQVPPQTLRLLATPETAAVGGTSIDLALQASGGLEPYQWSWMQTGGPAAVLMNAGEAVLTVELPTVTTATALSFEAMLTDANGTMRTAIAVAHAIPSPQSDSGDVPVPMTALQPRYAIPLQPLTVALPLGNVAVTQVAGPQLQFTQQASTGGTVVTLTAPAIRSSSVPASFTVTGTDKLGKTVRYFVPVIVWRPLPVAAAPVEPPQVLPPQVVPRPNDPLVLIGADQNQVDEGRLDRAAFGYRVRGGRGSASYVYNWEYLRDPTGPDVAFTPTRSYISVTLPANVDGPTDLRFRLTVSDGVQQAQRTHTLRINDLAPTFVVGAAAPITVQSAHAVTLSMPTVTGGLPFDSSRPPYDYSVLQTAGPDLAIPPIAINNRPGNFGFQAPALTVGAPDAVLSFELTATDRIGNVIGVTQQVTVTAPLAPVAPLVADTRLPATVPYTDTRSLTLQGTATGGVGPYTYAWTIQQDVTPVDGRPPFVLSDLQATGPNPTVTLPDLLARLGDIRDYRLSVSLEATDANGTVATHEDRIRVITNVPRRGSEALICGDLDQQVPCTDLDLVLAQTYKCDDATPYALNDIIKINDRVFEFRRCVNAATAYSLWYQGTRGNALCEQFDPSTAGADLTCHLACYGNACNTLTNPSPETLVGPPGPDGRLLVGGRVVTGP